MKVVEWCNVNQGFVTAIFSLLSLLLSFIAIVIAVRTAKLPYKRALRVTGGSYIGVGTNNEAEQGIYVNVLNVGSVPINVIDIGLLCGKNVYININTISEVRGILKPMESIEQSISQDELAHTFIGTKVRVYVFAKDAEGNYYKKYLCNSRDLQ